MPEAARQLILASGSAARKAILEAAGLNFDVVPANIDEPAIRDAMTNTKATPRVGRHCCGYRRGESPDRFGTSP